MNTLITRRRLLAGSEVVLYDRYTEDREAIARYGLDADRPGPTNA